MSDVRLIARPKPFSTGLLDRRFPVGLSIADMMRAIGLDPDVVFARVFLGDQLAEGRLRDLYPEGGQVVTVRVVPTFGDSTLNIIASIFFPPYGAYYGLTQLGVPRPLAGTLTFGYAGNFVALLHDQLVPPAKPKLGPLGGVSGETSPTLSITGSQNQAAPYGPIPRVYGRHRMFPPLAARTYTEIEGNDQYLRMLFCCGYGPLALSDFKIGATPIASFTGVQMEVRYGHSTDPALTLFPDSVFEDALSILLLETSSWQVRTTQPDADELSVDVTFPEGLVDYDTSGNPGLRSVQVDVAYRLAGSGGAWTQVNNTAAVKASATTSFGGTHNDFSLEAVTAGAAGNQIALSAQLTDGADLTVDVYGNQIVVLLPSGGSLGSAVKAAIEASAAAMALITIAYAPGNDGTGTIGETNTFYLSGGADIIPTFALTDNKTSQVRRGLRWAVTRGQYEVRVRRTTADTTDDTIRDRVYWTALRTIKKAVPITQSGLSLIAMRIKATDQLNGVVDQFNLIAESILPDWNGSAWVQQTTSNPASIYRNILQGSANARAVADSRVDLTTLQAWHVACAAAGREFNAVIDYRTTVFELLRDVAAVGRASFGLKDGAYSVVRDIAQSTPIQHFTPRNSWGFRGSKAFVDVPHALKMRFVNPDADWQQDERIVYDDGYNADGSGGLTAATRFETIDLFGVTDPEQAWKEGRYHIAVARLRPETYELMTDVENLICTRGDLARLVHDVPQFGLGQARVKSITADGGGNVSAMVMDDAITMTAGLSYAVRIRKSTGATVLAQIVTSAGEQTAVTFSSLIAAASAPAVGDLVLFGLLGQESVEVIVKSIEPGPDLSAKLILVDAAPAVHNADAGVIPAYTSQITLAGPIQQQTPSRPIVDSVTSDETVLLHHSDGALESRIVVALHFLSGAAVPSAYLQVQYRLNGSAEWLQLPTAAVTGSGAELSVAPVQDGLSYDIRLRSIGPAGQTSDWETITGHTVIGKTSKPDDITTLTMENLRLRWIYEDPPVDLDGFLVRAHAGDRRSWDDAIPLHDGVIGDTMFDVFPDSGIRTYLVKAVDVAGNESENAAVVTVNLGDLATDNIVLTQDYKTASFPGTKTNCSISGGNLAADSDTLFWKTDPQPFWTLDSNLFWPGTFKAMTYVAEFTPPAAYLDAILKLNATVQGAGWSLEYRPDTQLFFWISNPAPFWTGDSNLFWHDRPDFMPWPGQVVPITLQTYQFRVITAAGLTQGIISVFQAILDVEDIVEEFEDLTVTAGDRRLPLTETYRDIKIVNLTLQDNGSGAVRAIVVDKDASLGPRIQTFNAAGAPVAGLVDATVQGY